MDSPERGLWDESSPVRSPRPAVPLNLSPSGLQSCELPEQDGRKRDAQAGGQLAHPLHPDGAGTGQPFRRNDIVFFVGRDI